MRRGVWVMALAHLVNDTYAWMLPALLPLLLIKLELSLGSAGLLVTLYQASSSFTQPLLGHLADRGTQTRWMAWTGVAISGLAAGSLGLAPSFAAVALVLLAGGLGTALFHPVSASLVSAALPSATRGRWMSVYISAGNFGLPIGTFTLGLVVAAAGLGATWILAIPALIMAVLVWRFGPTQVARQSGPALGLREIVQANRRMLGRLVAVAATRAWASAIVASFLPIYAVARGASVIDASRLLTLFLLAGAVGGLIGGTLADRVGRDRVIVTSLLVSSPFCAVLGAQTAVGPLFIVATAVCGLLLNGSFVVLAVRGQESLPGSLGMVSGLMLGLSIGLGGLAVAPMAVLAERVGIPVALDVAGALAVACALIMRTVPKPPAQQGPRPAVSAEAAD
ncbi:MAG TPA: MFS transporter [Candidatus Limnocylindria bacterium]